MKFTIIMPTYNDSETILEAVNSVLNQTYQDWELLISDDGSTDNTKTIIKDFLKKINDKRIQYIYHENMDQLNAIMTVLPLITGDYVYILHSDDLFDNNEVLQKVANYFKINKADAIISGSEIINEKSEKIGYLPVKSYKKNQSTIALQLLWLGRNLFTDMAFHTKESFVTNVKNNYLEWNTPFWLDFKTSPKMLEIKNTDFSYFKYRVFEGNYINNELGKLNVLNGELRTAVNLMKYYNIPLYKFQYLIFRTLNKLKINYYPIYQKKEAKNKYKILKFIIEKRVPNYKENIFLNSFLNFYLNKSDRKIVIDKINKTEDIYIGADMRKFNKKVLNNSLSKFYINILNEMSKGFNTIITNEENFNKVVTITKFLCIYPFVRIEVKK